MKKVALITKNKILAQSLEAAIKAMPDLGFEFLLLLNSHQALLDATVFEIDVAVIDLGMIAVKNNDSEEKEAPQTICEALHENLPNCHILLLVSQDDLERRTMATEAKKNKIVEDYVFYDASLKYLLAKLAAFR